MYFISVDIYLFLSCKPSSLIIPIGMGENQIRTTSKTVHISLIKIQVTVGIGMLMTVEKNLDTSAKWKEVR